MCRDVLPICTHAQQQHVSMQYTNSVYVYMACTKEQYIPKEQRVPLSSPEYYNTLDGPMAGMVAPNMASVE